MAPSLEERLQQLERQVDSLSSAEAIRNLQHQYIRHLADRSWSEIPSLFTEDAVTDISYHGVTRGRAELIAVLERLSKVTSTDDAYIVSSPVIHVNGDEATGEWTWTRFYCDFLTPHGSTVRVWGPWMEGRYQCKYSRCDGNWKISYLHFRTVAPDKELDSKMRSLTSGVAQERGG